LRPRPEKHKQSSTCQLQVKCEAEGCENERFREVYMIRKISAIVTGSSKDSYMPIPTFECTKCGHINKEFAIKTK
jgi:uncharacterized Zn finger protein